jgi:hypothetical protein
VEGVDEKDEEEVEVVDLFDTTMTNVITTRTKRRRYDTRMTFLVVPVITDVMKNNIM